ncbi:endocuticle structural glycoprotein SgAbd-9-like [Cimex lectularius]|uniref:CPR type cuticle protein n=1 Tax=Cimex lectularius TaxID=79782 RepID=A0A8I6TFM7_CIMLE|nr:endocuticle structural glycoprotein SgAbd-9-like [Cimex lectularius]
MYFSYKAFLAVALVVVAHGAPQFGGAPFYPGAHSFVPIVSQHYVLNPDQSYNFAYRSGDGSARDEVGAPRAPGPEGPAVTVQGSYSYASPAGPVQVSYVADENGYQPSGPSVHPDIVKAVAQQVAEARATPGGGAYYNPGPAYRHF